MTHLIALSQICTQASSPPPWPQNPHSPPTQYKSSNDSLTPLPESCCSLTPPWRQPALRHSGPHRACLLLLFNLIVSLNKCDQDSVCLFSY